MISFNLCDLTHSFLGEDLLATCHLLHVAQYSFCCSRSSVDIETFDFPLFFQWKNTPFKSFLNKRLQSKLRNVKSALI